MPAAVLCVYTYVRLLLIGLSGGEHMVDWFCFGLARFGSVLYDLV